MDFIRIYILNYIYTPILYICAYTQLCEKLHNFLIVIEGCQYHL